jgi:hypothetical protein
VKNRALPTFAKAWLAQWNSAATDLAAVHANELRQLDFAHARAASEALLVLVDPSRLPPGRRMYSGLVEQQRLFMAHRGKLT